MMAKIILNQTEVIKFQIWCRLCLTQTDSVLVHAESLSWTQDVPKLEL